VIELTDADWYADAKNDPELAEWLDLSKKPKQHPMDDTKNEGLLGKFKDETNGVVIV